MIAIVGPGAVGGLLAALLHRSEQDVVAVARPQTAARVAVEGLTVESDAFGTFRAAVPATTEVPAGAAVLLTVKAYGLDDVLPGVRAARPREVLSVLNGLSHAAVVATLPGRPVSGSVVVEAAREDGVIRHHGGLAVNVPDDAADLAVAGALREAGVTVRAAGTEHEVLWRKFRFLAPTALLTSWAQAPIGAALETDPALTEQLVGEVAAVATADGVATEPGQLLEQLRGVPPTLRTSLQADLAAGGPTELEELGGELLARAERQGVEVPALTRVVGDLRLRLQPA